jgi:hypothetical protein
MNISYLYPSNPYIPISYYNNQNKNHKNTEITFYFKNNNNIGDILINCRNLPIIINVPFNNNEWIGLKVIVYNINTNKVKFETYMDLLSNGEVDKLNNIKNWVKIYNKKLQTFITKLNFNISNNGLENIQYKYFSIREIIAPSEEQKVIEVNLPGMRPIIMNNNTIYELKNKLVRRNF